MKEGEGHGEDKRQIHEEKENPTFKSCRVKSHTPHRHNEGIIGLQALSKPCSASQAKASCTFLIPIYGVNPPKLVLQHPSHS